MATRIPLSDAEKELARAANELSSDLAGVLNAPGHRDLPIDGNDLILEDDLDDVNLGEWLHQVEDSIPDAWKGENEQTLEDCKSLALKVRMHRQPQEEHSFNPTPLAEPTLWAEEDIDHGE